MVGPPYLAPDPSRGSLYRAPDPGRGSPDSPPPTYAPPGYTNPQPYDPTKDPGPNNVPPGGWASDPGYSGADVHNNPGWGGVGQGIKNAYNKVAGALGPAKADLSGVKQAQADAYGLNQSLGQERAGYQGQYNPAQAAQLVQLMQGQAAGTAPSAAEIQLRAQAARNEAGQYGLAAALQGNNPGAALRSAQMGDVAMQAQTNEQAAAQRAAEQQAAQQRLAQFLAQQRGTDVNWQEALLNNQTGALGHEVTAGTGQANASAAAAGAANTYKGGLLQMGGQFGAAMMSDKRTKTDIKPADLNKLADSLEGFTFRYKDAAHGEGDRVGVMAQDVKRGGPVGRRMVNLGPGGKLQLDIGNSVGAALAMSAAALRRSREAN